MLPLMIALFSWVIYAGYGQIYEKSPLEPVLATAQAESLALNFRVYENMVTRLYLAERSSGSHYCWDETDFARIGWPPGYVRDGRWKCLVLNGVLYIHARGVPAETMALIGKDLQAPDSLIILRSGRVDNLAGDMDAHPTWLARYMNVPAMVLVRAK